MINNTTTKLRAKAQRCQTLITQHSKILKHYGHDMGIIMPHAQGIANTIPLDYNSQLTCLFYIPLLNVYHIQYVHIEFHNYQNKENK